MNKNMKIGIAGAAGRMGRMLVAEVLRTPKIELSGATVIENDPNRGMDAGELAGVGRAGVRLRHNPVEMFENSDVVIDFTTPSGSLEHCLMAHRYNTALVIGTTGFNPKQQEILEQHAREVPIVGAPNMSWGVNMLLALTEQAARLMGNEYDIEIVEMHHQHKVDAPSGTALAMGKAAAAGRDIDFDEYAVLSREGQCGPRKKGEIGFATLRGGDVIGDHTVILAGDGERIEISHKASNRRIYAAGAVKAARWLVGQEPGFYSMKDVMGLA